jgi:hypothetical protein
VFLKCGAGKGCGRLVGTDRMRIKGKENILRTTNKKKVKWTGYIFRRSCFLNHVFERNVERRIEITAKQGRRCKQILDDLLGKRGYCKLKDEALDRTLWRTGF